mmetsp:Transcript_1362/g.2586  ORF Transcript_1362/g.2586 Transcript_1362/m.2586 type:complete len:133 (-) Transcript_1362:395-793(-)|eukprot:CAMPEP_0170184776 /NCGR_PEP_ID=MMETSP0040_2-20121228/34658_1 /TAXON_ID=641309 /ORGANISM="Lotharella oceanica, Strain CCMP622" /LENGTH=132 /DNA_ID=CAMNT_0010430955 /DNA_START=48 /DNA_END=446 /DNA_ORIENTATION=+
MVMGIDSIKRQQDLSLYVTIAMSDDGRFARAFERPLTWPDVISRPRTVPHRNSIELLFEEHKRFGAGTTDEQLREEEDESKIYLFDEGLYTCFFRESTTREMHARCSRIDGEASRPALQGPSNGVVERRRLK